MHTVPEVDKALELCGLGLTDVEVARRTGVPRSTVRDWRHGRVPRRGWPRAVKCCPICEGDPERLQRTDYAYLLGLYLGDGCAYSNHWPCLFPQTGAGRKHERPIYLADWQDGLVARGRRAFVRGLIHSDGCRVVANDRGVRSVRYHFSNKSEDIKRLFCESLDALDIPWTRPCERQVAVYRKAATARLDEFIGPKR